MHVRTLASEVLRNPGAGVAAWEALHARIAVARVITEDVLTGELLGYHRFASSFLDFLSENSSKKEVRNPGPTCVDLSQLVYQRPDLSTALAIKRCSGGIKYPTTFQCILALAQGNVLRPDLWDLSVFENEGIATIGSGGNHRTLAHLLFGDYRVTPEKIVYLKTALTGIDLATLNSAFLEIDTSIEPRRFLKTADQARGLIEWFSEVERQDRQLILAYLHDRGGRTANPSLLNTLKRCAIILQDHRGKPRWKRWLKNQLRPHPWPDSDFIRFIEAVPLFRVPTADIKAQ